MINWINSHGSDTSLPAAPAFPPPFYNVNGDDSVTAADVLDVVNYINGRSGASAEGEDSGLGLPAVASLASSLDGDAAGGGAIPAGVAPRGGDFRLQLVPTHDALAGVLLTLAQDQESSGRTERSADVELEDSWKLDLLDLDLEFLVTDTANE